MWVIGLMFLAIFLRFAFARDRACRAVHHKDGSRVRHGRLDERVYVTARYEKEDGDE